MVLYADVVCSNKKLVIFLYKKAALRFSCIESIPILFRFAKNGQKEKPVSLKKYSNKLFRM